MCRPWGRCPSVQQAAQKAFTLSSVPSQQREREG